MKNYLFWSVLEIQGATMITSGAYIEHIFDEDVQPLYKMHRKWLTCSVHFSIAWPEKDVAVTYDGTQFFLRGLKQHEDHSVPCISVRLLDDEDKFETLKKVYKFTSILGWYNRGFVDISGYVSGSHPILYDAGGRVFSPTMQSGKYGFSCNYMPIINEELTRKALAFWREGLKLEEIHKGYSFLSFYKVIESQFSKGKAKANWITQAIPTLTGRAQTRVEELQNEGIDVSKHVFASGRCAVAHASAGGEIIDPDIPEDKEQIAKDLDIIKGLAKKFIQEDLGVPDRMDIFNDRNSLEPLNDFINTAHLGALKDGGSVLRKKLGLNGLQISVNQWPMPVFEGLENLSLSVNSAHNGIVSVTALNSNGLALTFAFDFINGKAHTQLDSSGFDNTSSHHSANEITFLNYQKAVIGNGLIELNLPNGHTIDCEVVIPVNIDIGRSFEVMDNRIRELTESA